MELGFRGGDGGGRAGGSRKRGPRAGCAVAAPRPRCAPPSPAPGARPCAGHGAATRFLPAEGRADERRGADPQPPRPSCPRTAPQRPVRHPHARPLWPWGAPPRGGRICTEQPQGCGAKWGCPPPPTPGLALESGVRERPRANHRAPAPPARGRELRGAAGVCFQAPRDPGALAQESLWTEGVLKRGHRNKTGRAPEGTHKRPHLGGPHPPLRPGLRTVVPPG